MPRPPSPHEPESAPGGFSSGRTRCPGTAAAPDPGYLRRYPAVPRGDPAAGEIEVIEDPAVLGGPFAAWAQASGLAQPWIGVLYEDRYLAVIRDAVRFPGGALGTYLRVINQPGSAGDAGVAVVCVRGTELGLIRIYRHALRSWSLESPRGSREPGECPIDAARRELAEETGLHPVSCTALGRVHPDSGLSGSGVLVCLAEIRGDPRPDMPPTAGAEIGALPDTSEAIGGTVWVGSQEWQDLLRRGEVTDGITIAAVAIAQSAGLWPERDPG